MIIDSNGLKVPGHLTELFFKKALENGLKLTNIDIFQISFKLGSSGGENYCSEIYRTKINYKEGNLNSEAKEISLIVKVMNTVSILQSRFVDFFRREVKMYDYVIPEMEKLLDTSLAPKFFYSVEYPKMTMVFEDLNSSNYGLQDRIIGLNEEYSEILLKKLGVFHAASMVLAKKMPDLITSFNVSMFHEPENITNSNETARQEMKNNHFTGNLTHIANIIKDWPQYELISEKLNKVKENFKEKCLQQVSKGGINVLNHGDLWVNNFLFKNDSNGSINVKFIDLQLAYWGSLALDLHYFLNTSVQIDILKVKRNELLQIYYCSLKGTLEKLNYVEIPTWYDIQQEILQKEFYGFFVIEGILPIISLDRTASKDNSAETFADVDKMKKQREIVFSSKRMIETLKFQIKRLDDLGVFDQEF